MTTTEDNEARRIVADALRANYNDFIEADDPISVAQGPARRWFG